MNESRLIGITGGIGSGKSLVSRILRLKGYPVYDCDYRAKILMNGSPHIIESVRTGLGNDCITEDGFICRDALAARIFNDESQREWLNSLVHGAVRDDILKWRSDKEDAGEKILFVESAILYTSGIADMTDAVWFVDAPFNLRLERILERGKQTREDAVARMESQKDESRLAEDSVKSIILNNGSVSLLISIDSLLRAFSFH